MSFESCAFHLCMLSHGLLQMGSRHAPACPQQSVGRHGRRSAPNQHFATAVPMGSRDAGRGSPPGTRRRAAPIRFDHPRGRGDEAGSPSSFAIRTPAAKPSSPPPSCVKRPSFQMDSPSGNSQCAEPGIAVDRIVLSNAITNYKLACKVPALVLVPRGETPERGYTRAPHYAVRSTWSE